MGKNKNTGAKPTNPAEQGLPAHLEFLGLPFMRDHYDALANQAAQSGLSHVDYLAALADGETALRRQRSIKRRIKLARFPVVKTLEQFRWSWPSSINRAAVQNLFRLKFIDDKTNVILLGGVGLGKTHLATALGYAACLESRSVLFTTAVDAVNTLSAAQAANRLKSELKRYLAPSLLCVDELGFLPIDKRGSPICSSRSSVCAMSRDLWLSLRIEPTKTGRVSSTMIQFLPRQYSTDFFTTRRPSSSRARVTA